MPQISATLYILCSKCWNSESVFFFKISASLFLWLQLSTLPRSDVQVVRPAPKVARPTTRKRRNRKPFCKKKNVFFFSTWLIDFDLKRLTQSWGVRTFGKILRFLRNRKMCYDAPPKWKSSTMRQVFWSQPLQSLIAICQTVFFYHWEVCNVGLHGCILLRMFRTVTVINYYLLGCECPPCAGAKPRPWQACFWPKCFKTEQRCEDVRQCWVMFEVQTVKTAMVMTVVRVERPPGCGRVSLTWLTGPWTGWTGWSLGQLHRSGIQITSVTSTILSSFRQLGLQEGNSQVLREGLWEFWLLGNGQNEELAEFPCGCID